MIGIRWHAWLFFKGDKPFALWMGVAFVLMLTQMYLNTGTLSAYAVTLENPFVREGYIVNYDYTHYECNYRFIMGEPAGQWAWGWVLRRVLFFLLSYPWFWLFGFYKGGLVSAFIITSVSFYSFTGFVYRHIGRYAAFAAMALLATYPGIMYWIGSPFAQVMIVPCCCWLYMLLWNMDRTSHLGRQLVLLCLASMLFTAYDLFAFFYPAILLLYFRRRQWWPMLLSLPVMAAPQALIVYWLHARGAGELPSENSGLYLGILRAYGQVNDPAEWLALLAQVPYEFVSSFFKSGFIALPLLFLISVFAGHKRGFRLNHLEASLLLVALLIFLFNNLAPPYALGTSLRGSWISRIYQPLFVVMIMYIARLAEQLKGKPGLMFRNLMILVSGCVVLNFAINTGAVYKSALTQRAWHGFYDHSQEGTMIRNLETFGVRPLGFPDPALHSSRR